MTRSPTRSQEKQSLEMSGTKVILFLMLPSALIVGLGFILLAPILTAKKPGHLYIGLRFDDEASIQFIDKNLTDPRTQMDLYAGPGLPGERTPLKTYTGLRRGKNIIPTHDLEDGLYHLVFTSPGYEPVALVAEVVDGEFRKTPLAILPINGKLMDQFIGVILEDARLPQAPASDPRQPASL